MGNAVFTINLPEEKQGFFCRVPRRIGGKGSKKVSPAARAIVGRIFGVSGKKNQEKALWTSYDQMQSEFGVCRATVASSLTTLKDRNLIVEDIRDRAGTSFKYIGEAGKSYDVVPLYLYTADFVIDGKTCRLTKAQVSVLSFIMTESKRVKNANQYEGSTAQIAKILHLSQKTVKTAIKVLFKAKLLHRSSAEKGKNGHKLSVFHVDRKLFDYERKRKNKLQRESQAEKISQASKDANERAERKRYYDLAQEEAQKRAERYKGQVYNAVPSFLHLEKALKELELPLAKAEHTQSSNVAALQDRKKRLEMERIALMQRFDIQEDRMHAKYYAKCKRCFDTGAMSDGYGCTCYKERMP